MKKIFLIIMFSLCLCNITQAQTIKLDFLYEKYKLALFHKDYKQVKQYALPWLTLYSDLNEKRNQRYAEVEYTLAYCFFLEKDFNNSLKLYKDAYSIAPTKISTNEFLLCADDTLCNFASKSRIILEVLKMEELTVGKGTCSYAYTLIKIAEFYETHAPLLSLPFYEESVNILRKENKLKENLDVVLRLVIKYIEDKDFSKSLSLLSEIAPYIPSWYSNPYIWSKWMMATYRVNIEQYNYNNAISFIKTLEIDKNNELDSYANMCLKIVHADIFFLERNYELAEIKFNEILSNIDNEKEFWELKSFLINRLITIYLEQDDIKTAEQLCLSYLKENSTSVVKKEILEKLAGIYLELGDYTLAKQYYLEVADIVIIQYGIKHIEYAKSLNNLANVALKKNEVDLAQKAYTESLNILKKTSNPLLYSLTLSNLANTYVRQGKIHEAELCYNEALRFIEKVHGSYNIDYADILNNKAILYHINYKKYQEAYKLYIQAQEIRRKLTGTSSSKYLESEVCLFNLYNDLDISSLSTPLLLSIIDKKREIVTREFWHLSERQRKEFWNSNKIAFEKTYPKYMYQHSNDSILKALAYDNELFVKGLLLNTTSQIKHVINKSEDSNLRDIYYKLSNNLDLVLHYKQIGKKKNIIDSIDAEIEKLDKELMLLCSEYRESVINSSVSWSDIQNNLEKNEVAIEFSHFSFGNKTYYVAILIRNGMKYPEYIELKDFDKINHINDNEPYKIYSDEAESLAEIIWKPLLKYIKPNETIYFASSGLIHQLAIENLPYKDKALVSDVFNIVRLSSTREIISRRESRNHRSASLFGGIQYNLDKNNKDVISKLSATSTEVQYINELLIANNIEVQLFTSVSAKEEEIKKISRDKCNILHIATHGFYWPDSIARNKIISLYDKALEDPLNRSGLLFAGANQAFFNKVGNLSENTDDGILTAKEISLLDLRETNLVVLSACETGLGKISHEGVFGLQRAFKMAGVQTIIMSLWKVDDNATQMLMTEFYNNWISKKQSKREAFKNAQKTVRKKYEEPYYWAGFIMLD